jgi:hypothetical protein
MALSSVSAFASETCYQVSAHEGVWSRTPELLCIREADNVANEYEIALKQGLGFGGMQKTVATFNFALVSAVRCADCNKNVFGLLNPSNSSFNALSIRFDGTRDVQTGREQGTVKIGETQLFYRN